MILSRLLSAALAALMAGTAPMNALASEAQAEAIAAAETAHQKAITAYAMAEERAVTSFNQRNIARAKYQAEWQAYWEKRRAAEKAYDNLLDTRNTALNAARAAVTEAELAALRAEGEQKSANQRLLSMLRAQSEAEKGTDKVLARNIEARADELRQVHDEAADANRAAQDAVRQAKATLAATEQDFQTRLEAARGTLSGEEDLEAIEKAYSAALDAAQAPTDAALDDLALDQSSAGAHLLRTMLQAPPPFVERVTVRHGETAWYDARYVTDENGSTTADPLGERAYREVLTIVDGQIESADSLIADTEKRLAAARTAWQEASTLVSENENAIVDRDLNMLYLSLAVEATAVVASAAFTGGAAAPAVAALSKKLTARGLKLPAEIIGKVPKSVWDGFDAAGISDLATKAIQAGIGKYTALEFAKDPDIKPHLDSLDGFRSTVIGDVVEIVAKDGAASVRELVTSKVFDGAVSVDALTNVKIDAIATLFKAVSQGYVNTANARSKHIIAEQAFQAQLAKRSYFSRIAFRDALVTERHRLASIATALEDTIAYGLRPQRLEITTDLAVPADEAEQIADQPIQIEVHFSQPLEHAPSLSFDQVGIRVSKGEISEEGPFVWDFAVTRFDVPDGLESVRMDISLSPDEAPYTSLDTKPETPVRLQSLNAYDWGGFERGNDRNHALRLKPAETTVLLFDPFTSPKTRSACKTYYYTQVGSGVLAEIDSYHDLERDQPVQDFAEGEFLAVCKFAGEHIKDEQGRLLAIGWGDVDPGYANGYIRPSSLFFNSMGNFVNEVENGNPDAVPPDPADFGMNPVDDGAFGITPPDPADFQLTPSLPDLN